MENKGKNKVNKGEGSQQEETQGTLQPIFSSREIITKPTKKNEKATTFKDNIIIRWKILTLALIQIIKDLEARTNPASRAILGTKAHWKVGQTWKLGQSQKNHKN